METAGSNNYFRNIKYLHIIRGFAAFYVLLAHAKWPFWVGGSSFFHNRPFSSLSFLDKLGSILALCSSNGTAMVIVFFVLSGFIITHSYNRNNWQYREFIINRCLRIYIPYIASVILAGILLVIAYNLASPVYDIPMKDYHEGISRAYHEGLTVSNFIKTFFFIRGDVNYFGFNYVYWSLLYEMIFYLLFPFILKYYKQFLIVSIILYPLHFIFTKDEMQFFLVYFFIKYLFYFCSGIWLYNVIKNGNKYLQHYVAEKKVLLLGSLLLCFMGIVVLGFAFPNAMGVSFVLAVFFSLLWIVYILKHGMHLNFLSRTFLFLGEISYSLYLIHVSILLLLYSLCFHYFGVKEYSSPWVHFLVAIIILPVAYVFYVLFEKFSVRMVQNHKKAVHHKLPLSESVQPKAY
ncbi:MAG: acyltransferase family protein [Flavisolibacter sp.]